MDVAERIRASSSELTPAERRVAEVILTSPHSVGFGTVADVAGAAGVGAASVVRLAAKLGFEGYSALQSSVQHELVTQLRPAAERIRAPSSGPRSTHVEIEVENVRATMQAVDDRSLDLVTARLADVDRRVVVLSGDASSGVAAQFALLLTQLRDDVQILTGSDVSVRRSVALVPSDATAVVVDLRRYERWVLDAHAALSARGIWSVAVTDSLLSPIASRSAATFVVTAGSRSPFDSHVGTLSLLNLFVAEVATRLRSSASNRLAAIEDAWRAGGSLTDGV